MLFPFELAKLESKTSILKIIEPKFQSFTLNNLDNNGIFSKKENYLFNDLTMNLNENEKEVLNSKKKSNFLTKSHSLFEFDFLEDNTEIEEEELENEFFEEKINFEIKNQESHLKDCLIIIKNYKKKKDKKKKIKKMQKFDFKRKISFSTNPNSYLNSPLKNKNIHKNSKILYKVKQRLQTKIKKVKNFWKKIKILSPKVFKITKRDNEDNYIEEYLDLSRKLLQINSLKHKFV